MSGVGDRLPVFEAPLDDGAALCSGDLEGIWCLIYWFPRADTPGCTAQAEGFRDQSEAFDALGCRVVGASSDPVDALSAFRRRYRLPFSLLSDPDLAIADSFGALSPDGGSVAARKSFLIDAAGIVRVVYEVDDPTMHAEDVLDDLERLLDG